MSPRKSYDEVTTNNKKSEKKSTNKKTDIPNKEVKSKTNTTKKSSITSSKSKSTKKANSTSNTAIKQSTTNSTTKQNTQKSKNSIKDKNSKTITKTTSKNNSTKLKKHFTIPEYYDLPPRYTNTIVKILAQTPNILFIYWDISNSDRENFINIYGPSVFNDTKPVLIITNKTMNYTFELEINDYANCWYFHVNDTKCEYYVELGRRPINNNIPITIPNNYIYVSSSNVIEAPNDHILLEKKQNMVYFKNVKTNVISSKPLTSLTFINNMGKSYDIYEFYKNKYTNEELLECKPFNQTTSSFFK